MRLSPHSVWFVAGGCVAALAILAALLFLIPAATPPPPVEVTSIDWQLEQNPPQNGIDEFSVSWINQSGPFWGFPFDLPAGGTFNDTLVIVDDEKVNVPICSASISPPLFIVSTHPAFNASSPMRVDASEDNVLTLTLGVRATAGALVSATGIISATGCSLPFS